MEKRNRKKRGKEEEQVEKKWGIRWEKEQEKAGKEVVVGVRIYLTPCKALIRYFIN